MAFKEKIKELFLLLSVVENLQNFLFLRIKDPNINGAKTYVAAVSDSNANTMKSKLYRLLLLIFYVHSLLL